MGFFDKVKTAFLVSPSQVLNKELIDKSSQLRKDMVAEVTNISKKEYRVESYEDAIARLGLDKKAIARRRRELLIQSRIWYGLSLISLMYAAYLGYNGSIVGVIGALCIGLLIAFVSGFILAFRIHQIDKCELFSFRDFLKDSEGWLK